MKLSLVTRALILATGAYFLFGCSVHYLRDKLTGSDYDRAKKY